MSNLINVHTYVSELQEGYTFTRCKILKLDLFGVFEYILALHSFISHHCYLKGDTLNDLCTPLHCKAFINERDKISR